ncbi:hypothetical protein GCM10011380_07190 [Sphingomonas metalli]|uniref:Uncharacterized protein n=1 Tax=Sphingomonas metalli TaxID=1779358 RepID=A0A916SYH8_9SPHN|nr:hypothetical protein GCM10011380_07190 [Sphingomonas metalli]
MGAGAGVATGSGIWAAGGVGVGVGTGVLLTPPPPLPPQAMRISGRVKAAPRSSVREKGTAVIYALLIHPLGRV